MIGVYNGQCEAGASYVDARSGVEDEFEDVMDKVVQVEISMDIPNDGVQFVKGFPEDMKQTLIDGLLAVMETEEGQAAMDVAYEWDGLVVKDNSFYDSFRALLDAAGINAADVE